jgi:UDP-N-acetylmuramyl pentapeptide phosphotransferase/UDP-N-acetylglucosamine-1-phosphate transferase
LAQLGSARLGLARRRAGARGRIAGVHALALLIPAAVALAIAPGLLAQMRASGRMRANYRGRELPFPAGIAIVPAALLASLALAPLQQLKLAPALHPETGSILLYVLGVAFLGLLDDTLGDRLAGAPRGWRGHGRALLRGQLSTGVLKAAGSAGLALYALSPRSLPTERWLLASALLVLATHAFNLIDLRPGRAIKALALLGAGLTIAAGTRTLYALGPFLGPSLLLGAYDLREQALLGDTGASVLGALAGLWLVLTLSPLGQALALAALVAIALYGEFRSLSLLIERLPLLRHLDSVGRP